MSHYEAGTRFERKVIHFLIANGYEVVRAAGSKGTSKVDLVAFKPGQILFIQCKRSGAIGPTEWNRVYQVSGWVGAVPLVASNGPNGRGVVFAKLIGEKVPYSRTRPCEDWLVDEVAA